MTVGEAEIDTRGKCSETEEYGCCKTVKPRCLQCFNNVRCHVLWQCVFNFFEGFIVNGVINVVLVALEKRYSLSSAKSGLIASSNDFGSIVCSVLVGYFGEKRHKPRLMSTGILIMLIGSIMFSLPHFLGGNYIYTAAHNDGDNSTGNICSATDTGSDVCKQTTFDTITDDNKLYYALLMLGNILLGIGASPMFTVGLSYIDENCKPKMSSFYISWTYCAAAIGVAMGYVVGGQTLSMFVDIDRVNMNDVTVSPTSPEWVGAWWIAPLIATVGFLFVAFPIFGYPRRLPSYDEVQKHRLTEAHGGGDKMASHANFGKSWKDFPRTIVLLLKNPTYVFICLGAAAEALVIGGTATFGAKLLMEKFNIDLTKAGTIMGIITIPGSGGGMLLGGYLVKRFKLKCRGILRLCAGFMITALCFGPFLLSRCAGDDMFGIDRPYLNGTTIYGLITNCNSQCHCSTQGFEPLCMDDGLYFSPCHAGCRNATGKGDKKFYSNCECMMNTTLDASDLGLTLGRCHGDCVWLYVFSALFLVVMMLTFATMSPGTIALFRCVPDNLRSVGIGVNLLFVRLVGTMPGPIFLGAVIDSTCTVWQDTCGTQGSCWLYDKPTMALRIMLWFMGLKLCGFLLFLIASLVYKSPPEDDSCRDVENEVT